MRCSNCGWENPAEATTCVKCNAPLGYAAVSSQPYSGYSWSDPSEDNSQALRGTVPEGQIFGSGSIVNLDKPSGNVCPKCGYPLGRGISSCPRCGNSLSAAQSGPQTSGNPSGSGATRPGTVNPWARPQDKNGCSLTPVAWEDEANVYSSIKYSRKSIILNRANTDPSNNTITSKVQAELVKESDGWYLTDKSELQTTYVHAGRKTKLEDGDIVILGNRRFVFKG